MQVSLLVIGAFSALMLFSFGGQIAVAPALLPAQWFIARNTPGAASMVFSVLGALLTAEVFWIGLAITVGDGALPLLNPLIPAGGAAAGLAFFRISRPGGAP